MSKRPRLSAEKRELAAETGKELFRRLFETALEGKDGTIVAFSADPEPFDREVHLSFLRQINVDNVRHLPETRQDVCIGEIGKVSLHRIVDGRETPDPHITYQTVRKTDPTGS